ncbi:PH domain-containing protein [Haladaptatus pallidirubidus]|uniref:PH domain-containing protein n=1 Tax=Haladaptatus pallidirubidus TaxID=1008152 RepID=A0AAV3UAF6_9EURY|nr:PH domain-containing protein [Haladaptatus pallidirubidus]
METLNSRVRIVWFAGVLTTTVFLGAVLFAVRRFVFDIAFWLPLAFAFAILVVGGAHVLFKYRVWRFEIRDDDLYLERGVFTRVTTVVPFVRVQHVDTQRGPIERLVGLGSVVVYTAGSRGADVTIPGLTPERASDLQRRLRNLAIESEYEDAV